jgi:hypothetical protein
VKTQIWIAISVYVLVAIVKKRLGVEASLYTILQILSLTLFEKTPMDQLLNDKALQIFENDVTIQLNLFEIIAGQQCPTTSYLFSRIQPLTQLMAISTTFGNRLQQSV